MTFAELYNALLRCADDIIGCKMKLVIMTKNLLTFCHQKMHFLKKQDKDMIIGEIIYGCVLGCAFW